MFRYALVVQILSMYFPPSAAAVPELLDKAPSSKYVIPASESVPVPVTQAAVGTLNTLTFCVTEFEPPAFSADSVIG